jgi:hypothetical protein
VYLAAHIDDVLLPSSVFDVRDPSVEEFKPATDLRRVTPDDWFFLVDWQRRFRNSLAPLDSNFTIEQWVNGYGWDSPSNELEKALKKSFQEVFCFRSLALQFC